MLMVATVPSMIGCFNMNNIHILQEMGYLVDVACNFKDTSVWSAKRIQNFKEELKEIGVDIFQLDFSRSPLRLDKHIASYYEVKKLFMERQYTFIHTHTPVASAIVRLAAHKRNIKVIYTAHGFHFYHGAPIWNWIIFYPIEIWLSKYTDVLITINNEDYQRAFKKFKAKTILYVPGVGVDTEIFTPQKKDREKIRKELGLENSQIMVLSVGELNENKNHESVIRAMAGYDKLTYVIAGKGKLKDKLESVAKECNVDLRLTGYCNNVEDFYKAADIYVLPSIREGLNVSLMEAMSSGLPCLVGKIRGNTDLIDDGQGGYLFSPFKIKEIRDSISKAITHDHIESMGKYNRQKIRRFDKNEIGKMMRSVYEM